jgi:branched-subunit amino acid ABC-type transport system permease component
MFIQLIANSLIAGSIYSLSAFGFTLIYGTMRFFNMSYGVTFMAGAYLFYVFKNLLYFPFPLALGLSMATLSFLMVLLDHYSFRRLRRLHAPSWAIVMASIGVAVIIEAFITTRRAHGENRDSARVQDRGSHYYSDSGHHPLRLGRLYVGDMAVPKDDKNG